jgi:hypothetical protein
MKCADLEILLCDYVDGTLAAAEKATVELHLNSCAECRALVEDASAAVSFLEGVPNIEPPAALVNNILFEARSKAAIPRQSKGLRSWMGKWFEPILQPRFAMGMAMTILSFSMLGRFVGMPARPLKAADLEPTRIWATLDDKMYRTWQRAVKYYESMRLVYEIQSTLKDWQEPAADSQTGQGENATAAPVEGPIETKTPLAPGSASEGRVKQ